MTAFLLLAALACLLPGQAHAGEPPFNVVFIDICSARADHFGAYGYGKRTTPGMDAVAKESVVFERAMAQSSWCLSNYASLFTGQPPEVHGLYAIARRKLPESEATLAQKLKEAGYDTAAFSGGGTWLLPGWGLNKGFDRYEDIVSSSELLVPLAERAPQMLEWMRSRGKRPFFLYASVEDLHLPYTADYVLTDDPELDSDRVPLESAGSKVALLREPGGKPLRSTDPSSPESGVFHVRSEAQPELVAKYDSSLARADRQISRFLGQLKAAGLWEKTVVVIAGDHGDQLGEHGITGHMEGLYEPVTHVPLIVHHPGFPQWTGKRIGELVERVDLMPTLLDVAGVPYEGLELQGRSLLGLLREPGRPWREYAFASSKRSINPASDFILDERVVRTKRWKLHWYLHKGSFELYDLDKDPKELNDLSGKRPDIVERLSFELLTHLELSRPHAPGLPSGKGSVEQGPLLLPAPPD